MPKALPGQRSTRGRIGQLALPCGDERARAGTRRLRRSPPKAAIFRSGKEAGFIAGAIQGIHATRYRRKGRGVGRAQLEPVQPSPAVRYPTLALVRGHCLGGGLELALACRYLLAVDESGTKMGLPEVMLGIFPGWGACWPARTRWLAAAMDMMLPARPSMPNDAKRMGLADDCVPPRVMENAARMLVLSNQPAPSTALHAEAAEWSAEARCRQRCAETGRQACPPGTLPAPYAIIDIWAKHNGNALVAPNWLMASMRSRRRAIWCACFPAGAPEELRQER